MITFLTYFNTTKNVLLRMYLILLFWNFQICLTRKLYTPLFPQLTVKKYSFSYIVLKCSTTFLFTQFHWILISIVIDCLTLRVSLFLPQKIVGMFYSSFTTSQTENWRFHVVLECRPQLLFTKCEYGWIVFIIPSFHLN